MNGLNAMPLSNQDIRNIELDALHDGDREILVTNEFFYELKKNCTDFQKPGHMRVKIVETGQENVKLIDGIWKYVPVS